MTSLKCVLSVAKEHAVPHKLQSLWEHHITKCNVAVPTFNDDGPFAMWLWAVIVSIYLSMKQICRAGLPRTPAAAAVRGSVFRHPVKIQGLLTALHITPWSRRLWWWVCHTVCGAVWRTRGRPEVRLLQGTHIDLKHLCCLMSALPWGVYWWLPLIPLPARNMWGNCAKTLSVCVCSTGMSGCPLTLVVTVTPDSKLAPVAKQPGLLSHQLECPISTPHLEEGALRSLETYPSWQKLIDNLYRV